MPRAPRRSRVYGHGSSRGASSFGSGREGRGTPCEAAVSGRSECGQPGSGVPRTMRGLTRDARGNPAGMAKVDPIEVQKTLDGLDYPATKDDVVSHARAHGADDDIQSALERLPDREYEG